MTCNQTPATWLDIVGLVLSLLLFILFTFGWMLPDRRTNRYGKAELAAFVVWVVLLFPLIYTMTRVFGSVGR